MTGSSRGNGMYMLFLLEKYRHPNSKNDITDCSKNFNGKLFVWKITKIILFKWRKRQITWTIKLFYLILSEKHKIRILWQKKFKHLPDLPGNSSNTDIQTYSNY